MKLSINKSKFTKPKKSYSGRKWLGVLCLILALVIAFVVMPILYAEKGETSKVVVTLKNITKGSVIQSEDVTKKEVGIYGHTGYYTNSNDVVGKAATTNLVKGEVLTTGKINSKDGDPLSFIKQDNKKLVSITLASNAAGLASHLLPGDNVNVYAMREDEFGMSTVSLDPLLSNLEIYDLENSTTKSIVDAKKNGDSNSSNTDVIINTITFIASNEQAEALIRAEYSGALHVVLVKR